MTDTAQLEVVRQDLHETRIVEGAEPELGEGEALLAVDGFGITSNNVTYGAFGDMLGYWKFFPTEGEWGRVPAWGFASVVESRHADLATGSKFYGYLPMGTHLVVTPGRVDEHGFSDATPHRAELPPAYNDYRLVTSDPLYDADREAEQMLLYPLFITGFLIDDFLDDNRWFDARQVVLSSASSRTAIATARLVAGRGDVTTVGLTSPGRVEQVESLGCYDRVVAYDTVDTLAVEPAVFVDIAGDGGVRGAVHRRFGDDLRFSSLVGGTHWEQPGASDATDAPGPAPTFFFAPDQLVKRIGDWGRPEFDRRVAEQWRAFLGWVDGWFRIARCVGPEAVRRAWLDVLDGKADIATGYACSMR